MEQKHGRVRCEEQSDLQHRHPGEGPVVLHPEGQYAPQCLLLREVLVSGLEVGDQFFVGTLLLDPPLRALRVVLQLGGNFSRRLDSDLLFPGLQYPLRSLLLTPQSYLTDELLQVGGPPPEPVCPAGQAGQAVGRVISPGFSLA